LFSGGLGRKKKAEERTLALSLKSNLMSLGSPCGVAEATSEEKKTCQAYLMHSLTHMLPMVATASGAFRLTTISITNLELSIEYI